MRVSELRPRTVAWGRHPDPEHKWGYCALVWTIVHKNILSLEKSYEKTVLKQDPENREKLKHQFFPPHFYQIKKNTKDGEPV